MFETSTGVYKFNVESGDDNRTANINFLKLDKPGTINIQSLTLSNLTDGNWGTCKLPTGEFIICEQSIINEHVRIEKLTKELEDLKQQSFKIAMTDYKEKIKFESIAQEINKEIRLSIDMLNSHHVIKSEIIEGSRFAEFNWGVSRAKELSQDKQTAIVEQLQCPYGVDNIFTSKEQDSYIYSIWKNTRFKILESFIGEISGIILEEAEDTDNIDYNEAISALMNELMNGNIKTITL